MSPIHRRTLLRAGLVASTGAIPAALTACELDRAGTVPRGFVAPDGDEVRAAETARNPGAVRDIVLTAAAGPIDLGGLTVATWSYGGSVPGRPIRVTAGEVVRVTLTNSLPEPTTVHWHGLALRNDADGVPDVTQKPIAAGAVHRYEFTAAHPGTYWFHPHRGTQLDRGLYASALGLIRTGAGPVPAPQVRPPELDRRIVAYRNLKPADAVMLPAREPQRRIRLELTGGMRAYDWGFNGKSYDPSRVEAIRSGERVRIDFVNTTTMWHPVHLHGHTFAVGDTGVRKDTAIVLPGQTLPVSFDADNPELWMVHCHNVYHAEAGMMTLLGYRN